MQESDLPERDSKSERKRRMLALQKIGEALVNLPATQLPFIPLQSPLLEAIEEARNLKNNEAKRRILQYIGKLMRNVDVQPIEEALNKIQHKDQFAKAKFHQVERWRDQFIEQGDALLQNFLEKFPNTDTQQLRQLIRNAQKDIKTQKNTGAETALFRFLRDTIIT